MGHCTGTRWAYPQTLKKLHAHFLNPIRNTGNPQDGVQINNDLLWNQTFVRIAQLHRLFWTYESFINYQALLRLKMSGKTCESISTKISHRSIRIYQKTFNLTIFQLAVQYDAVGTKTYFPIT